MPDPALVEEITRTVEQSARYAGISRGVIEYAAREAAVRFPRLKEAVKAVKSKLHQVAGVYFEEMDFAQWREEIGAASDGEPLRTACREVMRFHASTRERLPILERLFTETLAEIAPVESVLDLACGLNPLAIPWMPLRVGARYLACDVYPSLAEFLNGVFPRLGVKGRAEVCDLTQTTPGEPVQLALLLKSLPCLEQMQKGTAARLLETLNAQQILVTYPAKSLGGRGKGMPENYDAQFRRLVEGKSFTWRRFDFPSETAYLLKRTL